MAEDFSFKEWILQQENPEYTILDIDARHTILETHFGIAEINEYDNAIYEFRITTKKDGSTSFYLHFALKDPQHAKDLFREMTESLISLKNFQGTRILLCCSSGLTTNFFAQRLNQGAELLSLNYEFRAISYNQVFEYGFDYDIILLAPQIGYTYAQIKEVFHDRIVIRVPTAVFAGYDIGKTLTLIREALEKKPSGSQREPQEILRTDIMKNDAKLLVIGMLYEVDRFKIAYRIIDRGEPKPYQEVIKPHISVRDIEDILDTVMAFDDDLDIVCLSMPGIVNDGRLDLGIEGFSNFDMRRYLSERYSPRFIICNNANAIALGIYAKDPHCQSLIFHSQPRGALTSGEGIILNGKLITGKSGVSGEMQYLAPYIRFEPNIDERIWTPEGALEAICRTLLSAICVVGPEIIYIRSELTPNMDDIRRMLATMLPEQFIPNLVHVKETKEYMFLGQMILCLERLGIRVNL